MNANINLDDEITELRGVFPELSRSDVYKLDNGNIGVEVSYAPNRYRETFDVLLEYPPSYPNKPPKAWVQNPSIDPNTEHVWGKDDHENVMICFIDPAEWTPDLTGYDAAIMVKTWIYAYCNWLENGRWDWKEKSHGEPDRDVFDLLPF